MHNRKTILSKAAALLSAGLVVASFTINNAASAVTITCVIEVAGGTGCQVGPQCPPLTPNQGTVWVENENCVYTSTGSSTPRLVKDQLAGNCSSHVSGYCCNNLDATRHCPSGGNCPAITAGLKCTAAP